MSDFPVRPLLYHCRRGQNDCAWIIQRMWQIPEGKRQEVANNYENLFMTAKNGRKEANEYLNGIATEYRLVRQDKIRATKNKPAVAPIKKPRDREFKSDCGLWTKKL